MPTNVPEQDKPRPTYVMPKRPVAVHLISRAEHKRWATMVVLEWLNSKTVGGLNAIAHWPLRPPVACGARAPLRKGSG